MKSLRALALASGMFCVAMASGATKAAGQERDGYGRFAGAWHLAWLEQPGTDGRLNRIECCGMLVFTPDGHMSVQVMQRDRQAETAAEAEQYSLGGYEASYGRFDVDEKTHTFTFHVEGALVRSLIGMDLVRTYEFLGKQLIVKSTRADERWRVVWEHY